MAVATMAPEITNAGNLAKETVCIAVSFGILGNSRKVANTNVQEKTGWQSNNPNSPEFNKPVTVDADKNLIHVSKTLLDSPELAAIKKADGEMRRRIYDRCLPFEIGVYILPVGLVETVVQELRDFSARRELLVEEFLGRYEMLRDDARFRLRSLFNPKDYPAVDRLRKRFYVDWQILSFGEVPDVLGSISAELLAEEKSKQAQKVQAASDSVVQMLYATFADVVSHLRERLTPEADGKQKVLRDSALTNVQDAIRKIRDFRLVSNDADLEKLASDCERILSGRSPDMLRESDNLRAWVASDLQAIRTGIDSAIEAKPTRKYRDD